VQLGSSSGINRPTIRRLPRWMRKYAFTLRLVSCFVLIALSSVGMEMLEGWAEAFSLLWVANGILLAYLLLAPRWRWPAYLLAGFAALSLRMFAVHRLWPEYLVFNIADMVEVLTGALLLRRRSVELPRFTKPAYLMQFFLFAVTLGPVLSAAVLVGVNYFWPVVTFAHPFISWASSDALGIATSTPAFVAIFQSRLRQGVNWRKHWIYPVLLFSVTVAAFSQSAFPLVFLIFPLLILVLVRFGLGYSSLCTIIVAAIAGGFTIQGYGPLAAQRFINPALPTLLLHVLVASSMLMLYIVSVVLESKRGTEMQLEETVALHNQVMENSNDAILITDFDGQRKYFSPAVKKLTGWGVGKLANSSFVELAHPDDRERVEQTLRELREGKPGALIEYRIRKWDGSYFWIEGNLRVIHHARTGKPIGILDFSRDITERKCLEQKLQDAYTAVEALATIDPLTNIANRRLFDRAIAKEWSRAQRDRRPLSLLMLDVDLFKDYNDLYGHPCGDQCLKVIAQTAMEVARRAGDLAARIGGEEFAVILPNTSAADAKQLGIEVCMTLRRVNLPHEGNSPGYVTVSIGCATLVPEPDMSLSKLIEIADEALYRAKRTGRNRVCSQDGE
jgi:diguanylate cyclase (GGDEF)-like protein/PAS domain S-box-containing protein